MENVRYLSLNDTAVLVRAFLKAKFPGKKFSVRCNSYAGGSAIRVSFIRTSVQDYTEEQVNSAIRFFEGSTFDGMTDCRDYVKKEFRGELVSFGPDYVRCTAHDSDDFLEGASYIVCSELGIPFVSYDSLNATYVRDLNQPGSASFSIRYLIYMYMAGRVPIMDIAKYYCLSPR